LDIWGYDEATKRTTRFTTLTLRFWGWTPREVYRVVVRAMEEERLRRVKALRRSHGKVAEVKEGDSGD
jgi:hypothetical protein